MNFFKKTSEKPLEPEQENTNAQPKPPDFPPHMIVIDGEASGLIKVVVDDPNLPEAKLDIQRQFGIFQPYNY
jgi:hypothetical protein